MKKIASILLLTLFTVFLNAQELSQTVKTDEKSGFKWIETYDGKNRGVMSMGKKNLIPCEYSFFIYSNGYFKAYKDVRCALFNREGKEVFSLDRGYTNFSTLYAEDGYIEVNRDDFKGVTDLNGKEIIPIDRGYTEIDIYNAKDGYFKVKRGDFKGVTDLNGKEIIPIDRGYTEIDIYSAKDGYFKVKSGECTGLTDISGNEIISPKRGYTSINMNSAKKSGFIIVTKNGAGVVDVKGTEIIPPVYGFYGCDVGLSYTQHGVIEIYKKSGDPDMPFIRGLFSTDGKELIPLSEGYRGISVSEGVVYAKKNYDDVLGDRFLISDLRRGVKSAYDLLYIDSELGFKIGKKGRYTCLLDNNNNELIPLSAHMVGIYKASNAKNILEVEDENGYHGLVTKDLKWIIPLGRQYTTLLQLGGSGKAPYYLVGKGDYEGVCDMAGVLLIDIAYDVAGVDDDGLAYGIRNDVTFFSYNYVNANGYYNKTKSEAAKAKIAQRQRVQVSNSRTYVPILINALAAAAAAQAYSNAYSSSSNYPSSYNSSSTTHTTRQCGLCGGTGEMVKSDAVSFGSTQDKWCQKCQRFVAPSHYHSPCISCNGKGYW